jgi:hypothetical protein
MTIDPYNVMSGKFPNRTLLRTRGGGVSDYLSRPPLNETDVAMALANPQNKMSRSQLLEWGLNAKKQREKEEQMAEDLFGKKAKQNEPTPITTANQAFAISKNPAALKERGMTATEALRLSQRMLAEQEEEEELGKSVSESILKRKKQNEPIVPPSMIGKSFGNIMR